MFRYLTSGFKFRERAALGYVQMNLPETSNIIKQFDIDKSKVQHVYLLDGLTLSFHNGYFDLSTYSGIYDLISISVT